MTDSLATVIGTQVRKRRLAREMSQTRLAAEAGTSPHAVVDIEGGKRIPTLPVLMGIAGVLDATLNDLCYPARPRARRRKRLNQTKGATP